METMMKTTNHIYQDADGSWVKINKYNDLFTRIEHEVYSSMGVTTELTQLPDGHLQIRVPNMGISLREVGENIDPVLIADMMTRIHSVTNIPAIVEKTDLMERTYDVIDNRVPSYYPQWAKDFLNGFKNQNYDALDGHSLVHADLNPGNIVINENICQPIDWEGAILANKWFDYGSMKVFNMLPKFHLDVVDDALEIYRDQHFSDIDETAIQQAMQFRILTVLTYDARSFTLDDFINDFNLFKKKMPDLNMEF